MTGIKLGGLAMLTAAVFLLAMLQGGRGYRSASDVQLRPVDAAGSSIVGQQRSGIPAPVSPRSQSRSRPPRPSQGESPPSSGKNSGTALPAPAAPSAGATSSGQARPAAAATPSLVPIERDVYYSSMDDYQDQHDDEPDDDEPEEDR